MKRCSALCPHSTRVAGLTAQSRRWMTYDKSKLTKEALLQQAESGLGHDADGNPLKINADAKTIATAVGQLPISPVMDPAWMQARRQKKKNKAQRPSGRFRRKLANNPFALALITSLRKCVNTGTIMPRYFLQDFELVKHPDPEEKSAWWAPGPLAFERIMPPTKTENGLKYIRDDEESDIQVDAEGSGPETNTARHVNEAKIESESSTVGSRTTGRTAGSPENDEREKGYRAPITGYALSRKGVIDAIGDPALQRRLLPGLLAQRHGMAIRPVKDSVWRADMGDLVLKMMRERAVDALIKRAHSDQDPYKFVEPCRTWDDVRKVHSRGCVLWLSKSQAGLHQYATLDVDDAKFDKKVPVHNLAWLVGEEEVKRLRDSSAMFRDNDLLVLKRWRSDRMIKLHMLLWRLQGYLDGMEEQ